MQRYGSLIIFFSNWQPSKILDLLGAYCDHPRWPLGGLYCCAKFGWNQCSSARLAWKGLFMPLNWSFLWEISTSKWGVATTGPPKGTSCAETRYVTHRSSKLVCWCRLSVSPRIKKGLLRNHIVTGRVFAVTTHDVTSQHGFACLFIPLT